MSKGWFRKTFKEYNKWNTNNIEEPKVNIINKNPNSIRFGRKSNKINNYGKENE